MDAFWIILTGSLVASSCGILGCFLLLRKMTMVGDAISHAVLPGIVIAYIVAQSRASVPMLVGASIFGVLTTVLIELLNKKGKMQEDASIGLTFTWMFAMGIIMVTLFANQVDLDLDCVLFGEIAFVPLNIWFSSSGANLGPATIWVLSFNLIIVVLMVYWGYKAFVITSFDPVYASTIGISTSLWHYVLMSGVSLTTVFSFESVGAILVVAFLVVPAAIAYLLTESLLKMIFLAVLSGCTAAFFGFYLALWVDGSISGAMATVLGVQFILVLARQFFSGKFLKKVHPILEN